MIFKIKNYFTARPGSILVEMDYSSEEYKVLGHYSNDHNFSEFIRSGKDIHIATAAMLLNKLYEEITDDERQKGKTGNFAAVYGIGLPGIANSMGYKIDEDRLRKGTAVLYKKFKAWDLPPHKPDVVTLEKALDGVDDADVMDGMRYFFDPYVQEGLKAASAFKKKYFGQFPNIQDFLKACQRAAADRGYVKTWTGRRRHFKNPKQEAYKGPNAVIQGGCGDVIKLKMYELMEFIRTNNLNTLIVNNIHDALLYDVPYDEVHLIPYFREVMEDLPQFRVPITADCKWGFTWGSMKDFESVAKLKEELGV